jgi:hypothetical protein
MQQLVKNFQNLKEILNNDPEVQQDFKEDPIKAAQKFKDVSAIPDNWIYRIVVGSLGLVVIVITMGVVWRVASGANIDDKNVLTILTALGSAAIGALAGLLAPSPKAQA